MRLALPEPSITLYDDGLEKHDKLDRQPLADRLSDLVENNDDPLVIALDGGWGSGKSLFEVGAEVRIKITDTWGVVPFFEGGSVFDSALPDFSRKLRWGAR